jgi:tRNA(fMet)-specific endonuclease VapC
MSGRYLLDTSVAIRVLNQKVDLGTRRGSGLEVFICPTVIGELAFGAEKSSNTEANRVRIDGLIELCPVVPQDIETAYRYGAVKAALQRKGKPIPENDLWIAACALRYGLILAARDSHFGYVDGLQVEDW